MTDELKIIQALQNCVAVPKCRDCPWEECEYEHESIKVPKSLLLSALNLIREKNGKIWTLLTRIEELQSQGMIDDGR